jgi:hypothetical protein
MYLKQTTLPPKEDQQRPRGARPQFGNICITHRNIHKKVCGKVSRKAKKDNLNERQTEKTGTKFTGSQVGKLDRKVRMEGQK